jgi:hypothetical protein
MTKNPEPWLKGHKRNGAEVGDCCAGCGKPHWDGACVIPSSDWDPANEPDWPFDRNSCPICALQIELRNLQYKFQKSGGPEDKLTERLLKLRARQGNGGS